MCEYQVCVCGCVSGVCVCVCVYQGSQVSLRGVENQSVPLALDVVIFRLLGNVEAVELQLPGELLLPLKDHQGNLRRRHWVRTVIKRQTDGQTDRHGDSSSVYGTLRQLYPMMQRTAMTVWKTARNDMVGCM